MSCISAMTVEISQPDKISTRCDIDGSADRCQELAALLMRHTRANGKIIQSMAIEQLDFTQSNTVSTALHDVFEPILAIVVQGQKKALLGGETHQYSAG